MVGKGGREQVWGKGEERLRGMWRRRGAMGRGGDGLRARSHRDSGENRNNEMVGKGGGEQVWGKGEEKLRGMWRRRGAMGMGGDGCRVLASRRR
jgi:hypothetical protein